jgi:hypothetical protein
MAINWQEIITTLVATVGGGGVLLAVAAWLIKTLVSTLPKNPAIRLTASD